jgi:hypothetical protein
MQKNKLLYMMYAAIPIKQRLLNPVIQLMKEKCP